MTEAWTAEFKGDLVVIKFNDRDQSKNFWNGFGTMTAVSETTGRRSFVSVRDLKNRRHNYNRV